MISTDDLGRISQETDVVSKDGDRLGHVHQIYTSDASGDPAWVTVHTGRFGSQESFVPLADATFDGQDVRVSVDQDAVHGAPRVDAGGHLSVEEEDDLYRYYQIDNPDHTEEQVADAATGTVPSEPDPTSRTEGSDGPGESDESDESDELSRGDDERAVGAAPAAADDQRDDELAERDAEGRDEVADVVPVPSDGPDDATAGDASDQPRRARASDDAADAGAGAGFAGEQGVRPGERTTRLRRYVVTERVVQTIEEIPDDDPR